MNPWFTASPAVPLFSLVEVGIGGGAKSLKVVSESARLAAVCMRSKAKASCSFSMTMEFADATDPRRFRKLTGDPNPEACEPSTGLADELLAMLRKVGALRGGRCSLIRTAQVVQRSVV